MREGLVIRELIPREFFIGRRDIARFEAEFLEDNVPCHGNSHRFVERQMAVKALPSETAVGGKHQFVGGYEIQATPRRRWKGWAT